MVGLEVEVVEVDSEVVEEVANGIIAQEVVQMRHMAKMVCALVI
jgi:hypothetical protein